MIDKAEAGLAAIAAGPLVTMMGLLSLLTDRYDRTTSQEQLIAKHCSTGQELDSVVKKVVSLSEQIEFDKIAQGDDLSPCNLV